MTSHQYLVALKRYWYIVIASILVGLFAGWGLTHVATKVYTADASLYFSLSVQGSNGNDINQGATYTQNQMLSFAGLATSTVVLQPVIDELGLDTTPAKLAKQVDVSTPQSTVILDLAVSNADAHESARIANAIASSLRKTVEEIAPTDINNKPTVQVRIIQPAVTPVGPSSPNERLNILAGFLLGLIVGALIVMLRTLLDTRVQSESIATQVSGRPILGSVQQDKRRVAGELVLVRDPRSNAAEAYRQLRSNLEYVAIGSKTLCVVVTSSSQGEGKSTIALNLALALSEGEQRVLLVDADLRRPTIARYAGLEGEVGLTTILVGRASFDEVVQHWGGANLDVLPSGHIPPNPSEILSSRAMADLLAALRDQYDVILIDTAPVNAVADAAIIAPLTDGALVIVDRTKTRKAQLSSTVASLTRSGVVILGIVLNRLAPSRDQGNYYYQADEPTKRRFARTKSAQPHHSQVDGGPLPDASSARGAGGNSVKGGLAEVDSGAQGSVGADESPVDASGNADDDSKEDVLTETDEQTELVHLAVDDDHASDRGLLRKPRLPFRSSSNSAVEGNG